ncbi:anaerobic ribonucleoside-triphosphate reductase activating protein [Consotaella aegiceratis]|uniref:anaerobic ribonucleoside-triphosphate reductase activating protein n=1 Tax=Consotaella aegiceratis TaxID=3097961 RepID=UPI002F3E85F6
MTELRVGGLAPLSTCDWPGQLVATIFCQGCPWRCPYCHNPHLLAARGDRELAWPDIGAFLRSRRNLLDGVVFSGGEPTLQKGLPEAMHTVRDMGFKIGLHTGGAYPARLREVLPLVDWVGFDIKAPFADYDRITGAPGGGEKARQSLRHLVESSVAFQLRTTVHPRLLSEADIERLRADLAELGLHKHTLQQFRAAGCADPSLVAA